MIKSTDIIDALGGVFYCNQVDNVLVVINPHKQIAVFHPGFVAEKDFSPIDFTVTDEKIRDIFPKGVRAHDQPFVSLSSINEHIEAHPTKTKPKEDECFACDATGSVVWSFREYRSVFECPVCDGMGATKSETEEVEVPDYSKPVKLIHYSFDLLTLETVARVMRLAKVQNWMMFEGVESNFNCIYFRPESSIEFEKAFTIMAIRLMPPKGEMA